MITKIERFKQIFDEINKVRIGLYGDFCLDAYWVLDPRGSEISLETGLKAQAVKNQNYSLGGASNVAANISALNPKKLKVFGIYGKDVFGKEMISQLNGIKADTEGLVLQKDDFETYTFSKRILDGKEQARIDFGTYNTRSHESDEKVLKNIKNSLDDLDVFVLNQQVPGSITNMEFIDGLNEIIAENPEKTFLLDSRHFAAKFRGVSYKVNNLEALNLVNEESNILDEKAELIKIGEHLFKKTNKPVFITRGENGIVAVDRDGFYETPGINLESPLDIVGAGDTVFGTIACALGAGCIIQETIELANLAAAVTVQKLYQTGTATKSEILNLLSTIE